MAVFVEVLDLAGKVGELVTYVFGTFNVPDFVFEGTANVNH
jgi:hypothetical protein